MRVKLYTAPGMPEALARIRTELGDDAIILSTRRIQGGVEVTASLETPEPSRPPLPAFEEGAGGRVAPAHNAADRQTLPLPLWEGGGGRGEPPQQPRPTTHAAAHPPLPRSRAQAAMQTEIAGRAAPRHDPALLLAHNTPAPLAARLAAGPLPFALSIVLRFHPLDLAKPLLVVGPPGAGKTLTIARLATRRVLQGARPVIATADTSRTAAFEQLAAYTDLLGLDLHRFGAGPTAAFIDTAGLDPFDPADRTELQALAAATGARMALVLPAGLDPGEAADLAQGFAACGASHLIATRLDVARRLGGILAAAQHLPLAEAGISPSAAEGLQPMTPELLAACLQRRPRSPAR